MSHDTPKESVDPVQMIESVEVGKVHAPHNEAPVLHRVYNVWSAIAYQVLIMASWTCNVVLYTTVFDLGGPMMLIYSTIIVCIGQCLMMTSLAELCGVWPHAGGQQAFVKLLAPQQMSRFLSYIIGYVCLLGEVATSAGCAMNNALTVGAIVRLTRPEYVSERWQIWLLYAVFLVVSISLSITQKLLPMISFIGGVITVFGGLAWAISFLALAPKQSASFVFTEFINNSGYKSSGWVGIMSFYTPIYALYGTDGILHIAEEIKDAEKNAPRAMIWSMIVSGITSLLGALVMGFCAGNWSSYIATSDVAFVDWFVDELKSVPGGIALVVAVIITLNLLIVVGINTAASRLAWSMARDNALPWSSVFTRVSTTSQTPMNAIFLIIIAELLIGVVVFGSDYAFQAIISVGGAAVQLSYLIPVVMLIIRGRDCLPIDRLFNLGRSGWMINVVAVGWSALVVTILFFPLYVPVTTATIYNMNWAIVVFGAALLLVTGDWLLRGRFSYLTHETAVN